jgi:hypothetical protein
LGGKEWVGGGKEWAMGQWHAEVYVVKEENLMKERRLNWRRSLRSKIGGERTQQCMMGDTEVGYSIRFAGNHEGTMTCDVNKP